MRALSLPCPALAAPAAVASPLLRLDARVKLLLLAAFTLSVVSTPPTAWPVFAGYFAIVAGAVQAGARAGVLPWRKLGTRLLLLAPFIAMAGAFLPFHSAPPGAVESAPGAAWLFFNFTVKSLLGASATLLLAASTPFPKLLAGLEALRVPRVAVMIFSFTYRYLFVLGEEALRMKRACDSRCHRGRWITDAAVVGRMAGTLFLRSYERGERVYLAMLARGFEGVQCPAQAREETRLSAFDLRILCGTGCLLLLLWTAARVG